jgi:hypothetical protein
MSLAQQGVQINVSVSVVVVAPEQERRLDDYTPVPLEEGGITAMGKQVFDQMRMVPRGIVFEVKDLFTQDSWNTIERGDRIALGRFVSDIHDRNNLEDHLQVAKLGRNEQNHLEYIKQ